MMIQIKLRRLIEIVIEFLLIVAVTYLGWQYKIDKKVLIEKKQLEVKIQEQSKAINNFLLDLKGIEDIDGLQKVLKKYKIE